MKHLGDVELQMKLQHQKKRYFKAEKMFEENDQEFQDKHYAGLCKVIDNIVEISKEIERRIENGKN